MWTEQVIKLSLDIIVMVLESRLYIYDHDFVAT